MGRLAEELLQLVQRGIHHVKLEGVTVLTGHGKILILGFLRKNLSKD
ncbi:MAG: hypothetical protein NUV46_04405 [Nanoarchaeota archaeon]|nr:hypothetical protein [Nanoarchaeota archaeon]